MIWGRFRWVAGLFLAVFLLLGSRAPAIPLDAALEAYQENRLPEARRIAKSYADEPLGRLILGLCEIHGRNNRDYGAGLETLLGILNDKTVERGVRVEAGLAYARMVQLLQVRERFPEFNGIDVVPVYRELIELAGESRNAVIAALYLADYYMDCQAPGSKRVLQRKAISLLENFSADFEGPEHYLVPILLYLDRFYLLVEEDFQKSFEVIQRAYNLGIEQQLIDKTVLFKLGRISELKLGDNARAGEYYREFLEKYPHTRRSPMVRRYLKELTKKGDS